MSVKSFLQTDERRLGQTHRQLSSVSAEKKKTLALAFPSVAFLAAIKQNSALREAEMARSAGR